MWQAFWKRRSQLQEQADKQQEKPRGSGGAMAPDRPTMGGAIQ